MSDRVGNSQTETEREICPYCRMSAARPVVAHPHIVACPTCGLFRPKPRMDRAAQVAHLKETGVRLDLAQWHRPSEGIAELSWELRLLKRYLPYVCSGGRVLDVGAAEGTFVMGLAREGARAVGLEPLGPLAAFARRHGAEVWTGRFERETMPEALRQEPFDLICFRESWYYLPDLTETFGLIRSLLAPTGSVYLKSLQGRSLYFRVWPTRYLTRYGPAVAGIPTPEALRYLFTTEGFGIQYVADYPSSTLRIFGLPFNTATRILSRIIDPWCRPLLRMCSWNDRLVLLAKRSGLDAPRMVSA